MSTDFEYLQSALREISVDLKRFNKMRNNFGKRQLRSQIDEYLEQVYTEVGYEAQQFLQQVGEMNDSETYDILYKLAIYDGPLNFDIFLNQAIGSTNLYLLREESGQVINCYTEEEIKASNIDPIYFKKVENAAELNLCFSVLNINIINQAYIIAEKVKSNSLSQEDLDDFINEFTGTLKIEKEQGADPDAMIYDLLVKFSDFGLNDDNVNRLSDMFENIKI